MTAPLRPMNLGEILDRTFQIYRAKFLVFVGIAAVPFIMKLTIPVLGLILGAILSQTTFAHTTRYSLEDFGAGTLTNVILAYSNLVIWPVLTLVASRQLLCEDITLRSAVLAFMGRWRSFLALTGILWAAMFWPPWLLHRVPMLDRMIFSAQMSLWGRTGAIDKLPFALLTLAAVEIFRFAFVAMMCLSVPIWTMECLPIRTALRKGFGFAQSSYRHLFAAWCLAAALQWVLYAATSVVLAIALQILLANTNEWEAYPSIHKAAIFIPVYIASTLTGALFPIAMTLIYYDQRIRREGYDIERMMDSAGLTAPLNSPEGAQIVAPEAAEEAQP